jgi:metallo-beta-lactamase family protein
MGIETGRPTLRFLGGTGTVTGSRYLIEHRGRRALVDCGLFQGYKQLRNRNWARFPVPPESIERIVLTHAHLDHSGYVPRLIRLGFRGEVLCTAGTRDLCGLLLPDCGYLQEEEAEYARRKKFSRHDEPQPLYTAKEAEESLHRFRVRAFDKPFDLLPGVTARLVPAGHLLGAAQLRLEVENGPRVHFTGDLGRPNDELMHAPAPFAGADVLVCESTYGNRRHAALDVEDELAAIVNRVVQRGGVLVVPAFAVGRVQGLMLHLARLRKQGRIPAIPTFVNSPMAIAATDIYERHIGQHRITHEEFQWMYEGTVPVRTVEESKALNQRSGPMIIISSSGMLVGGRVLHHLVAFGSDPRNAILLTGFQAGGTRGAALLAGADTLRMFGRDVPIRAEVVAMQSLSGHADTDEMMDFLREAPRPPRITYLTHGEPDAADTLRARIERELKWPARVPEHLEEVPLPEQGR